MGVEAAPRHNRLPANRITAIHSAGPTYQKETAAVADFFMLTSDYQVVEGYEAYGAAVAVNYYGAGDLEAHQQADGVAGEHVRGQRQHRL